MAYSTALSPSVGLSSTHPPHSTALSERRFLSEAELGNRWGVAPRTLARWRGLGQGPAFNKFSKRVVYPLDGENGVIDYEKRHLYASTSERMSAQGGGHD